MPYPGEVPRWCDTPKTARTVPPEGLKDVGSPVAAKWPAQYLNWLHGWTGDWIAWLKGVIDNGLDYDWIPDGDHNRGLGNGSRRWGTAHLYTVCGNTYQLDSNYDSVICVPLGSGHPTEVGGAKWTRAAGTPPELWLSAAASGSLTFDVQVPHGSKVTYIMVDWQAHAVSPGTKMRFSAQKHGVTLAGSDGEGVGGEDFLEMLSTTNVPAQASTSRKWALMTTNQNNTGFDNSLPNPWRVRIRIEASTESGADIVYGVYVICTHRSAGHLSLAPAVT